MTASRWRRSSLLWMIALSAALIALLAVFLPPASADDIPPDDPNWTYVEDEAEPVEEAEEPTEVPGDEEYTWNDLAGVTYEARTAYCSWSYAGKGATGYVRVWQAHSSASSYTIHSVQFFVNSDLPANWWTARSRSFLTSNSGYVTRKPNKTLTNYDNKGYVSATVMNPYPGLVFTAYPWGTPSYAYNMKFSALWELIDLKGTSATTGCHTGTLILD